MDKYSISAPARGENVFSFGNVRISVLEARLLRLEWSADGIFDDRPTQNVTARDFGAVSCRCDGNSVDTGKLKVTPGDVGEDGFSAGNLEIGLADGTVWRFGDPADGNLGGTCAEFDMMDGRNHIDLQSWLDGTFRVDRKIDSGEGLISRSGWAVFDDSRTAALKAEPVWGEWVERRPENQRRQDLYFFGFGHDYKAALRCGAALFGPIPMLPRFAFGYWYSRYWAYDQSELEEIVRIFNTTKTPLDVLCVDMDWHKPGWANFEWDTDFLYNPAELIGGLAEQGIRTTFNLHPGDLRRDEPGFEDAGEHFTVKPDGKIAFELESPVFMRRYFDMLLHPKEKDGATFWWIDMREDSRECVRTGFSQINWMNHLHYLDRTARFPEERTMVLACRGGMGGCRYPAGFSADVCCSWATLAAETELTATAANVLFGYWSHDLGGHMEAKANTPELNLRWMQFGCFSPVMRSHSAKFEYAERRFWEFPSPWNKLMRETILKRYEILPYLYTESRISRESGLSICRPLYYEYPESEEAYRHPGEYFFGSEVIVAPVTVPADPETCLAESSVYLPEGDWFDAAAGKLLHGPCVRKTPRMPGEIPLFIKAGAVLPGAMGFHRAGESGVVEHLLLNVYPGESGEYELYEDDGHSLRCDAGEHVRTRISHRTAGRWRTVTIDPAQGRCEGWKHCRTISLKLYGTVPPVSVSCNGRKTAFRYDGNDFAAVIALGSVDTEKTCTVIVEHAGDDVFAPVAGMRGAMRRIERIARIQNLAAGCFAPVADDRLGQKLFSAGYRISADPACCEQELDAFRAALPRLRVSMTELHRVRGERFPFSLPEATALLDAVDAELKTEE